MNQNKEKSAAKQLSELAQADATSARFRDIELRAAVTLCAFSGVGVTLQQGAFCARCWPLRRSFLFRCFADHLRTDLLEEVYPGEPDRILDRGLTGLLQFG